MNFKKLVKAIIDGLFVEGVIPPENRQKAYNKAIRMIQDAYFDLIKSDDDFLKEIVFDYLDDRAANDSSNFKGELMEILEDAEIWLG